ncbi:restriction endonuclease subunit S [candidate division WOR-3 bacterium]|nr:restriction endonuclease subunit S [candidate division WOR-3 bacterium]
MNGSPSSKSTRCTTLGEVVEPRTERVSPQDYPTSRYVGLEHVEAHTSRLLGTAPAETMSSTCYRFQKGDVLYGRLRSYLNKVWLADFDGLCSSEFIVLPETQALSGQFLRFRLAATDFITFAEHHMQGDRPRADFEQLASFQLALPSKPIQRRIAGILDEADRLRRMRRYALELSDQFLPALFLRMFGDPAANPKGFSVVPAGKLFHIQLGKMLDEKRYTGRQLRPYLGNANVQWGYFDLADVKQMDFPPDDFEKFRLRVDDILVCEGGEVGRTAIWRGEIPDCCYQKAVHRLRLKTNQIRPDYFQWYMWAAVASGLVARETSTSTIGHFTAERFEVFPIVVPPAKVQDDFVGAVAAHREHQSTLREALRQAENLFQSLLNQYFGKETWTYAYKTPEEKCWA